MKEKIKEFVIQGLEEIKELNGESWDITDDTVIMGEGGILDSFSFVSLVADVEEKISDEFGKSITLVSEKAFSKKYSPFKTVDRIADFCIELMNEAE